VAGTRAPHLTRSVRVDETGDVEVADIVDLDAAAGRNERRNRVTDLRRTLDVQWVLAVGPNPVARVGGGEEADTRSGGNRGDAERVVPGVALDADAAVVADVGSVDADAGGSIEAGVVGMFRAHFF
jgi:hypothetical protein